MTNSVFRIFSVILTLGFVFQPIQVSAQNVPLNIAVVDYELIIRTASAHVSIRQQIQQQREAYRQEVQNEEAALRTGNQELAQKQTLLSPEAFAEERRKFEQRVLDVQKKVQQRNQNLQLAQRNAQEQVKNALRQVVLEISQQNGYTLVIQRAQTVVVADQLDITQAVISQLNAKLPSVQVFQ